LADLLFGDVLRIQGEDRPLLFGRHPQIPSPQCVLYLYGARRFHSTAIIGGTP
jgi:hypothetical protein